MSLSGSVIRKRRLIVSLAVLLLLSTVPRSIYAQDGQITHIVRQGETLTSIANRYHVSVNAIISANHLTDGDSLYIGERLIIPGTASQGVQSKPSQDTTAAPGTYVVQPGDTLIGIADRFGVSVDQLMAANKLTDPALVQIGRVLTIP